MGFFCKELNKNFETKDEMFKELIANMDTIIDFKKSAIQKSCEKGAGITCKVLNGLKLDDAEKAALSMDDDHYYIATNSTWILDSHEDLHVDNLWNKTVDEQQGKNYLVADHELTIDNTIVRKEHVEMLIVRLSFAALKMPYEGYTQVLVYKVRKDKVIHQKAKDWLDSGDSIEASVRMKYLKLLFAMDSNDPEYAPNKATYDKYYPKIANKADFEYIPYYYAILEAANVREASLVIAGSNPATGQIVNTKENIEPEESTQTENKEVKEIEPTQVIQKLKSSLLLT